MIHSTLRPPELRRAKSDVVKQRRKTLSALVVSSESQSTSRAIDRAPDATVQPPTQSDMLVYRRREADPFSCRRARANRKGTLSRVVAAVVAVVRRRPEARAAGSVAMREAGIGRTAGRHFVSRNVRSPSIAADLTAISADDDDDADADDDLPSICCSPRLRSHGSLRHDAAEEARATRCGFLRFALTSDRAFRCYCMLIDAVAERVVPMSCPAES
uniref:Uncharacterized protein n=1 Tax=Plectus sambesii TaxID=2011161 RepID=A0A914W3K4_9BILA